MKPNQILRRLYVSVVNIRFPFSTARKTQASRAFGLWNYHWRTWKDISEWSPPRSPLLPQWWLLSKSVLFKPSKFRRAPQGDPPKGIIFPCGLGESSPSCGHPTLQSLQWEFIIPSHFKCPNTAYIWKIWAQWHSGHLGQEQHRALPGSS